MLSVMTKGLGGIFHGNLTGYCVICWAWKHKWVPKPPSHKYFISCKTKEDGFVKHGIGWIDMKHKLKFEQFQYCWKCGLPQGDLTPVTHPTFKPGGVLDCPSDNLVVFLIWHVIHMEDVWMRACSTFNGLSKHMPLTSLIMNSDKRLHAKNIYTTKIIKLQRILKAERHWTPHPYPTTASFSVSVSLSFSFFLSFPKFSPSSFSLTSPPIPHPTSKPSQFSPTTPNKASLPWPLLPTPSTCLELTPTLACYPPLIIPPPNTSCQWH